MLPHQEHTGEGNRQKQEDKAVRIKKHGRASGWSRSISRSTEILLFQPNDT
jgi:hypothetical protein